MGNISEKPKHKKSELLVNIAALPEDDPRLVAAAAALAGQTDAEPPSLRLYRMGEAAQATGRSRCSLWRAAKEGRIRTVQLREGGAHLIPEAELRKLAGV